MRVLLVSSQYPPAHSGGAERCVRALAHSLRDAGHAVEVAAPVPSFDDGGVSVRSLPQPRSRLVQKLLLDYVSPRANSALESVMNDFAPDVVHIHNVYGIGSALIGRAAARAATVVTLHDYWPMDVVAPGYSAGQLIYPGRPLRKPWQAVHRAVHRRNLRQAHLSAPSKFLADRISTALDRRVDVIPNGVALPAQSSTLEPVVLYAGRLVGDKGIAFALPVVSELAGKFGWSVDVLGDGPLRSLLERSCPGVRFHGAVADPAPFFGRASILIVPSLWPENAPLSLLEGMSHGVVVVAAAAGGIPEYLQDGENGLLFAPGDADALRMQLLRAMTDRDLRESIATAARGAAGQLGWARVTKDYVRLYERILGEYEPRGARDAPVHRVEVA